jgi:NAD(P)-dependent dehydrogenase (short-subunit alcohol dehydrogenase family)
MSDLSGKTAFVTGSVQGIGLAIAKALGRGGCARGATRFGHGRRGRRSLRGRAGGRSCGCSVFPGEICAMSVQLMHL